LSFRCLSSFIPMRAFGRNQIMIEKMALIR
jgi:hypothetical protein